jgi:hypothetical protein
MYVYTAATAEMRIGIWRTKMDIGVFRYGERLSPLYKQIVSLYTLYNFYGKNTISKSKVGKGFEISGWGGDIRYSLFEIGDWG